MIGPGEQELPIPTKLQRCVVFFGLAKDHSLGLPQPESTYRGTGFIVSIPISGSDDFAHNYIVTNAHVADHLENSPNCFVRLNSRGGGAVEMYLDQQRWVRHPRQPNVDIAVLQPDVWRAPKWRELDIDAVTPDEFLASTLLADGEMGVGDPIHVSGLLWNAPGATRNMPLVRSGTLAATASEPVLVRRLPDGTAVFEPVHLGVIQSIGGMSGSPTFIEYRAPAFAVTPVANRAWGFLLGINGGHYSGYLDGAPQGAEAFANAGINIIYPAERLLELLDVSELRAERVVREKALRQAFPCKFSHDS
jgi:hypothetical protein